MKWWWKGERLLLGDLVKQWNSLTPTQHMEILTMVPAFHVTVARLVRYHEAITRIKEAEDRERQRQHRR